MGYESTGIDPGPSPTVGVYNDNTGSGRAQGIKKLDPTPGSTTPIGTESNPEKVKTARKGTSDYDSGDVQPTTSLAAVTTATVFPEVVSVVNLTDVMHWVTVTDTAGNEKLSKENVAPRKRLEFYPSPQQWTGIKVQADAGAALNVHIAGRQA